MPITPDFDYWLDGLPVLHLARELDLDLWLDGLPVMQLEEAVGVPRSLGYLPPVIVND